MRFSIVAVLCLFPLAVGAATPLKPGLWEMAMKSDMVKAPNIPPAQLEKLRKMGIEVPTVRDGAMVMKVCITPEMAQANQTPDMAPQQECKVKSTTHSGTAYSTDLVCNGPNIQGNGTIKGTITNGERISSTYDFKGTSYGKPVTQHHETDGKWLGANCGNVKPMMAPTAKK
jgi:hypothetical protein